MTTYGLLIFEGAEELDWVGPWEVFTVSEMVVNGGSLPEGRVVSIAEGGGVVRCNKGLRVLADHDLGDHPPLDVVLVPGGQGTRREADNEKVLAWLRDQDATTTWTTSVCTGALLLHTSGVAEGKKLATHWSFEEALEQRGANVVRDRRWVRDGKVVSSQGVSAGIDMALWLIGQIHGPDHARAVQKYIQYDPAPPYQADV